MMIQQSLLKPSSISFSTVYPGRHFPPSTSFIRCGVLDSSSSSSEVDADKPSASLSLSAVSKLMEPEKSKPYPGGMGPYTGRDPNVKKPEWLRQRAPQGQRFQEIKESLSHLKLNTVCEEAQCPNIGEVLLSLIFLVSLF